MLTNEEKAKAIYSYLFMDQASPNFCMQPLDDDIEYQKILKGLNWLDAIDSYNSVLKGDSTIIDKYLKAEKDLYDHVGFEEGYVMYPIDISTEVFWHCDEKQEELTYSKDKNNLIEYISDGDHDENNIYTSEIVSPCYHKKGIYRGSKYTAIVADPQVDRCQWLMFLDNEKEVIKNEKRNN